MERYDVFLSHAGEDKEPLAVPAYNALRRCGFRAFLDRLELRPGDQAPKSMLQAIETSPVGVFLLSPEFAAKQWTMRELYRFLGRIQEADIQNRQEPILIPVFHRLTVEECTNRQLFARYAPIFLKFGFVQRMEAGETTIKSVQDALATLAGRTGIVPEQRDSNASAMQGDARDSLIHKICESVHYAISKYRAGLEDRERSVLRPIAVEPRFRPTFYAPENVEEVLLSFYDQDSSGRPLAPEAKVLREVLCEEYRVTTKIIAIRGMAGVGKSCVLRALAKNDDVKRRFLDGVFYIVLGTEGDMARLVAELLKVLRMSGGEQIAAKLRSEDNIDVIIHEMQLWFAGRKCLLLLDDFWEQNGLKSILLTRVGSIFSDRSGSVLAVSTRFQSVAVKGKVVDFEARQALSEESQAMLLRYARFSLAEVQDEVTQHAFQKLLLLSGGLPFRLASTGRGVAELAENYKEMRKLAWTKFAAIVDTAKSDAPFMGIGQTEDLSQSDTPLMGIRDNEDLFVTLQASLRVVEQYHGSRIRFKTRYSLAEMHRALCVVLKSIPVQLSTLRRLWTLQSNEEAEVVLTAFADAGLAEVTLDNRNYTSRMRLHDLIHEFSVICAKRAGNEGPLWYRRLLNSYISERSSSSAMSNAIAKGVLKGIKRVCQLLARSPIGASLATELRQACERVESSCRPWWSIPHDQFLHSNLPRLLVGSGGILELVALLLTPSWALFRHSYNNASVWNADFEVCLDALDGYDQLSEEEKAVTKTGLGLIRGAVREGWGFVAENRNEFAFQTFARLHGVENHIWPSHMYLSSLRSLNSAAWLQPFQRNWPLPGQSCLHAEVLLGDTVNHVAVCDKTPVSVAIVGGEALIVDLESALVRFKLQGHADEVSCAEITPDEEHVITGSYDGTVRIWSLSSGSEVCEPLRGHRNTVFCVAVDQAGRHVVSGSYDCTLRVWEISSGKQLFDPLCGHEGPIHCVAISPGGREIVSGSDDGNVRVWSLSTGVSCGVLGEQWNWGEHKSPVKRMKFHPDGHFLVTGADNNMLQVWHMSSKTHAYTLWHGQQGQRITSMSISPDGTLIASGSEDCTARVWIAATGEEACPPLRGHKDSVSSVAFSPDGALISGSVDQTVRVWNINNASEDCDRRLRHGGVVRCLAVCANGKRMLTGSGSTDNTLRVWNIRDGGCFELSQGHEDSVCCVKFSPDGSMIVSASYDNTMRVWDVAAGLEPFSPLRGHTGSVYEIAINEKGDHVASASVDGTMRVWQLDTESGAGNLKCVCKEDVLCLAISPPGEFVIFMSQDCTLQLVSVALNSFVCRLQVDSWVHRFQFVSNNIIHAHGSGGSSTVWKLTTVNGLVNLRLDAESSDVVICTRNENERDGNAIDLVGDGRKVRLVRNGIDCAVLATLPAEHTSWCFDRERLLLVTGLANGQVLWYRLIDP